MEGAAKLSKIINKTQSCFIQYDGVVENHITLITLVFNLSFRVTGQVYLFMYSGHMSDFSVPSPLSMHRIPGSMTRSL